MTLSAPAGDHMLCVVLDPGNIAPTDPHARTNGVLILTLGTLVSAAHESGDEELAATIRASSCATRAQSCSVSG